MQGGLNGVIARCEELKREGKTNIMLFREKHNKGILYREQIQLYETNDIPEKYDGWFKGDKYL